MFDTMTSRSVHYAIHNIIRTTDCGVYAVTCVLLYVYHDVMPLHACVPSITLVASADDVYM